MGGPVISRGLMGGMVTFCVSGIIVWWSFGVVALLQIVAISLVDNQRVDIYIGLQLYMDTRKIVANPPHPIFTWLSQYFPKNRAILVQKLWGEKKLSKSNFGYF